MNEKFDVGEMDCKVFVVGTDMTGSVLHFFCDEGFSFGIELLSHALLKLGIEIMVTMAPLNKYFVGILT